MVGTIAEVASEKAKINNLDEDSVDCIRHGTDGDIL